MSAQRNQVSSSTPQTNSPQEYNLQRSRAIRGRPNRTNSNLTTLNNASAYPSPASTLPSPSLTTNRGTRIAHRDANGFFTEPTIYRGPRPISRPDPSTELPRRSNSTTSTNTTTSTSITSTSRRNSLKSAFTTAKRRLSLLTSTPSERRRSLTQLKTSHETSVEAQRRLDPQTRPQYQINYMLNVKNAIDKSSRDANLAPSERGAARAARRADRALKRAAAGAQSDELHANEFEAMLDACTREAIQSQERASSAVSVSPTSTLSGKEMDQAERAEALAWAAARCGVEEPAPRDPDAFRLRGMERLMVVVGERVVDRVLPGRRGGSADPGLFGDEAPEGSMEACRGCGVAGDVLSMGRCGECLKG